MLATLLTLAATMAFTLQQTPLYTSTSRVLVKPVGVNNYLYRTGTPDMPTEAGVAMSEPTASEVQRDLATSGSPQSLLGGLDVTNPDNTTFLDFAYTNGDPAKAQELSTAFADAYINGREDDAKRQTDEQATPLQSELDQLTKSMPDLFRKIQHTQNPSMLATLTQDLAYSQGRAGYLRQQLLPFKQASTDGGDIVLQAQLPTMPSSPSYPKNLSLALMVGLAIGAGTALLREKFDDRLRGSRDLEKRIGAPILALIPKVESWKKRDRTVMIAIDAPKGPIAEAYRTLRTNLQFIAKDGDFKVIAVTSGLAGEGKTTTVANLAATLAQSGLRVIAVSCDLRKPRLHTFFGVSNEVGVTTILSGKTGFTEAALRPTGIDTLRIIPSGPVPSNPSELLNSEAMKRLIADLRNYADFVLLDTPPVLAVSDSLVVSPYCDGVVILADAESTSHPAASHTRSQLEQVGANIIGGILNNFDPTQIRYYPYENPYYYSSYDYHETDKAKVPKGKGPDTNGHKTSIPSAEEMWRA